MLDHWRFLFAKTTTSASGGYDNANKPNRKCTYSKSYLIGFGPTCAFQLTKQLHTPVAIEILCERNNAYDLEGWISDALGSQYAGRSDLDRSQLWPEA